MEHGSGSPFSRYSHFILLLWEEKHAPDQPSTWRMSLEDPRTGKRTGFTNLEDLMKFLEDWMTHPVSDDTHGY